MKVQISRRASYDIILVSEVEFLRTEHGIINAEHGMVGMKRQAFLETNNDRTLKLSDGTVVYGVEDYSALQVIAIANGVEICDECHKLENTPEGISNLCDPCQCEPEPEPEPEFMGEWENPSEIVAWGIWFGKYLTIGQRNAHRDRYAHELGHIPIYAIDDNGIYLTDRGLYQGQPISDLDSHIHLLPIE